MSYSSDDDIDALLVELALTRTTFDWRTPLSLAKEVGLPVERVLELLDEDLADQVRRPALAQGKETSYYRLKRRGMTWMEKWRILRAYLAREL